MSIGTIPPLTQWKRWIPTPPVMAAWGVLLLVFLWTYWETLFHVVRVWYSTPDYGHGFFVPIFAGFLLWQRQEMVDPWPNRGTWWGIPFFAVFALIRWFCLCMNYERDIDSLIAILVWRDARCGRMACPAVGVAFDRLFDFHGATSGLRGHALCARSCNTGHHHERLRPANARHPGHRDGRSCKRHPAFPGRRISWKLKGLAAGCGC